MANEDAFTSDQIEFTNAFNNQRVTLAGFAKCGNIDELHIVRDGFYLGLANDLGLPQYQLVAEDIVIDERVAESTRTTTGFSRMIQTARESKAWDDLVSAVRSRANRVGSDITGIWMTLETGRLDWLKAINAAHPIKTLLKEGLERDSESTADDEVDAKMIWIYCLCLNFPRSKDDVETWCKVVKLKDKTRPLVGYDASLWDPRKDEWRPLDIGARVAAERGGSSIEEAWNC